MSKKLENPEIRAQFTETTEQCFKEYLSKADKKEYLSKADEKNIYQKPLPKTARKLSNIISYFPLFLTFLLGQKTSRSGSFNICDNVIRLFITRSLTLVPNESVLFPCMYMPSDTPLKVAY